MKSLEAATDQCTARFSCGPAPAEVFVESPHLRYSQYRPSHSVLPSEATKAAWMHWTSFNDSSKKSLLE
jgi:hypothetical protein